MQNKLTYYLKKDFVIVSAFFLLSLAIKLFFMLKTPFAFGVDGYYYANQVQHLVQKGFLVTPDSSPALYFLSFWGWLFQDPVIGNKIGAALLSSALIFPAYRIGKKLKNRETGLLLAMVLGSSFFIHFFSFEFLKNLGGVFVFLFLLSELIILSKKKYWDIKSITPAVLWLFVNLLTHKLTAGLGFLATAALFFQHFKNYKKLFIISGLSLFLAALALIILFPNLIHWQDFSRFSSFFISSPKLPALDFVRSQSLHWVFWIELVTGNLMIFASFLLAKKQNTSNKWFFYFILFLLVILNQPFLNLNPAKIGFRVFLISFIPASIIFTLSISLKKKQWLCLFFPVFLLYQSFGVYYFSKNQRLDYELLSQILPLINLPQGSLLIAHQGFDYFYWYHKNQKAFHFLPEAKHQNRPLFRLVYGVSPAEFEKISPNNFKQVLFIPGFYSLMPEAVWNDFLSKITLKRRKALLSWRNPHRHRPGYMLRNQKYRRKNRK